MNEIADNVNVINRPFVEAFFSEEGKLAVVKPTYKR